MLIETYLVKKFHGTFSRVPWNFLNNIWTTPVVPWNSMEFCPDPKFHGIPWNFFHTPEFDGIPWNAMELLIFPKKFHGIPWNSMELFWSSMEFHGIPWNLINLIFKRIIFLNIVVGIWLRIWCYLVKISQKRYILHWFQYRNSYFEHPSVSENGTRSAKMACCLLAMCNRPGDSIVTQGSTGLEELTSLNSSAKRLLRSRQNTAPLISSYIYIYIHMYVCMCKSWCCFWFQLERVRPASIKNRSTQVNMNVILEVKMKQQNL